MTFICWCKDMGNPFFVGMMGVEDVYTLLLKNIYAGSTIYPGFSYRPSPAGNN